MKEQAYEQLTLSAEDFPVNRFPSPGSDEARKMTVTSGQRCSELYASFSPLGWLVKTCLGSSIWHSTRCYLTWKTSATPHRRLLFQLAVSTPRTSETDAPFWPTPKTTAPLGGCSCAMKTLRKMAEKGLISEEERRSLAAGNGGKTNPQLLEWLMGYEQKFTELIPTPRACDYKGAAPKRWYSQTVQVERERERETGGQVPPPAERTLRTHSAWADWPAEPELDRVAYGIPNRVDRIKCLGNAVVPQQFYPFFAAIAEIEKEMQHESDTR